MVIEAFASLILYVNKGPNWDKIKQLVKKITSSANNNTANNTVTSTPVNFLGCSIILLVEGEIPYFPFDFFQVNALNIAAYESFLSAAHGLCEDKAAAESFLFGRGGEAVKRIWNRHFELPSGSVHVSTNGYRRVDVQFFKFSNEKLNFQVAVNESVLHD